MLQSVQNIKQSTILRFLLCNTLLLTASFITMNTKPINWFQKKVSRNVEESISNYWTIPFFYRQPQENKIIDFNEQVHGALPLYMGPLPPEITNGSFEELIGTSYKKTKKTKKHYWVHKLCNHHILQVVYELEHYEFCDSIRSVSVSTIYKDYELSLNCGENNNIGSLIMSYLCPCSSSYGVNYSFEPYVVARGGCHRYDDLPHNQKVVSHASVRYNFGKSTRSPMLSSSASGSSAENHIRRLSSESSDVKHLKYFVPIRDTVLPDRIARNPILSKGTGSFTNEFGRCVDVPGDGLCGSHAVNIQSDNDFFLDHEWATIDDILISSVCIAQFTHSICYDVDSNSFFIVKSPDSLRSTRLPKICRLMRVTNHFVKVDGFFKGKSMNSTLYVNWGITIPEISHLLPNMSLSQLIHITLNPTILDDPFLTDLIENATTDYYPIRPISRKYLHLENDLNRDKPQRLSIFEKYMEDPVRVLNENLQNFTYGVFQDVPNLPMFGKISKTPVISIEKRFFRTAVIGNEKHHGVFMEPVPNSVTRIHENLIESLTILSEPEEISLLTSSDMDISSSRSKFDQRSLKSKQSSLASELLVMENTKSSVDYENYPNSFLRPKTSIRYFEQLLNSVRQMLPSENNPSQRVLDYLNNFGKTNFIDIMPKETEFDSFLLDYQQRNLFSSKELQNAHALLWMRGQFFENLIKYHKSTNVNETTFFEFLLKLNSTRPELSKEVFKEGLDKISTKSQLESWIILNFGGPMQKIMNKLLFDRTPDIMQIEKGKEWYTFVVCDPSSSSLIESRHEAKQVKYGHYSKLINTKKTSRFILEHPVVDHLGGNVLTELETCSRHVPTNKTLVTFTSTITRLITACFNNLRKTYKDITNDFNAQPIELNMGTLEGINYKSYLTKRDKRLVGLNDFDLDRIFDLEVPMEYEKKENHELLERSFCEQVKDCYLNPTNNGSCSDKRTDIHLDIDKRNQLIKNCCEDIRKAKTEGGFSHDPMGYMPAPVSYNKAEHSGFTSCFDGLEDMRQSGCGVMGFLSVVAHTLKGNKEACSALDGYPERHKLYNKYSKPQHKRKLEELNRTLNGIKIVSKNTIRLSGNHRDSWLAEQSAYKTARSSLDTLKGMEESSIDRISRLINEMETESIGCPKAAMAHLFDTDDMLLMTDIERIRMTDYFKSKGSQFSACISKMCFELNFLLAQNMNTSEIAVSNLGLTDVIAIVMPGCRLSDSSSPRHVKFCIKGEILEGQGFRMTKVGDWYVQDGYSKITSKIITHMINMPMALAPYYNETYDTLDSEQDKSFKRSLHQVYWMAGDTGTNKMLGVVRYLGLLIFSYVCDPVQLIKNELSQDALKWRRDIHIYTIDRITKNLPTLCIECSKLSTMQSDDGSMVQNRNIKFKRLLHEGHHSSFRSMLNEFYMYYTWNKTQTSSFEGQKKVFNKLLAAKYDCQDNIDKAIEQSSSKEEYDIVQLYLNTGLRIGFSKKYQLDLTEALNHALKVEKRTKLGMGFAPFLSLAAETWFDHTLAADLLPGKYFQPLRQGVQVLSNTRGSLDRTELVDNDTPLITQSLNRLNQMDQLAEQKKKEYHRLLSAKKITREEYNDMVEGCELTEDEDIPMPEMPEFRSIYDSSREIFDTTDRLLITKKKITKMLKKSGYDVRSKCIVEVIKLVQEHIDENKNNSNNEPLSIDVLIHKFITGSKDMLHGLSPKIQHLSARELRIMDILSKAGMKVVEDLARVLNSCDERETSTTDKVKQKTQESNSREIDHFCQKHNHVPLKLSADKSKWGPTVLPTEMIPLLRVIGRRMPHLSELVKLCIFMVIKLQTKRVLPPTELIAFWGTYKLDMTRLEKQNPEVFRFLNEFDPDKRCTFDNISDMGQGIMNGFTSFKHLACTSLSDKLYDMALPNKGTDMKKCQLSSDDSLEMVTFKNDKYFKSRLTVWLIIKNFSWRLCNIINNNKKTAGSLIFSEFNSNFNMAPYSAPPNLKQIVSAASVQFDYSWTNTVKSKLSEIKAASEYGVTNSTCRILNYINKYFYESVFSIKKIRSIITLIDSYNSGAILDSMSNGCIEFGRFPIVDPVSLSLFGMSEVNVSSLKDRRQMNVLTNIKGNIFFETPDLEVETEDYNMNLLSIRSMRMRVHKIEQLESARRRLFPDKEAMESLKDRVQKMNPFYTLKRAMTLDEQQCSLYNTFMSSSMQNAYTNITTTRGLMRLFGMKTTTGYGLKGSKTENCSFITIMVLMNMATFYDLENIDLTKLNKKDQDDDFIQVEELMRVVVSCPKLDITTVPDLPKPLEIMLQISTNNLDMLKNTKPDRETLIEWNLAEPTLTRVPSWNNDYKTGENPLDILESMWYNDLPGSFKVSSDSLDVSIVKEMFGICDTASETVEQWGLSDSINSITQIANWLCKMMKSTYKPSRLTYGRATTSQGMLRYMSDLYCFNDDTQVSYESNLLASTTPKKWNYSDKLYEYLSGLSYLTNCFSTLSTFKQTARGLRKQVEFPDIELSRVVLDQNVATDLRFIAAVVLKDTNIKEVDGTLNTLLLPSLVPRSHTYRVVQPDINGKFIPDSRCSVLYSSKSGDCTIIKEEGRRVKIHLNRDLMNDATISDNLMTFFSDHFLTRMFNPEFGFDANYSKLKAARSTDVISYFNYNPEKKNWYKSSMYNPNSIPVCIKKEQIKMSNFRPVKRANMVLDWNTKCFVINPNDQPAKNFFATQVLNYHGNFIARPSTPAMCGLFRSALLRSISEQNKIEIIMAISVFDDLALRGFANDFSGAAIAATDLVMSEKIARFDKIKFNSFMKDLQEYSSFKSHMEICELEDPNLERSFVEHINGQIQKMKSINNVFMGKVIPEWAKGLAPSHFNYQFTLTNVEIVQPDISCYDEHMDDAFSEPEELTRPFFLDLTQRDLISEPASKKINTTRKRCVDKWRHKSVLFAPTASSNLSKRLANIHISQCLLNDSIDEFNKVFQLQEKIKKEKNNKTNKRTEPQNFVYTECDDHELETVSVALEKLNVTAAVLLESQNQLKDFEVTTADFDLKTFNEESYKIMKRIKPHFDTSKVRVRNLALFKLLKNSDEMSTELAMTLSVDPKLIEELQENDLETLIDLDEIKATLELLRMEEYDSSDLEDDDDDLFHG